MKKHYEPGEFGETEAVALHGQTVTVTTYDSRDKKGEGLEAATYEETQLMYLDGDNFVLLGGYNDDGWFGTDGEDGGVIPFGYIESVEVH